MSLLFIIPWIAAAAVAYYYTETIGCRLKKEDPTLYNKIKNDTTIIDDLIKDREEARQEAKKEGEEAEETLKDISESDENYEETKEKVDKMTAETKKIDEEIAQLKTIKEKGLNSIHWSTSNIAWTTGIFLVVGLVLHYLMKKIMSIFFTNKEN